MTRRDLIERIDLTRNELTEPVDLEKLATEINRCHAKIERTMMKTLPHAIEAGRLLIKAKEGVEHGNWLPWLEDNTRVSERTAQVYMRLARLAPEIEAESAAVADLTLRGAIKRIRKRRRSAEADSASGDQDEDDRTEEEFEALCAAYLEAGEQARQRFYEYLDETFGLAVVNPRELYDEEDLDVGELPADVHDTSDDSPIEQVSAGG